MKILFIICLICINLTVMSQSKRLQSVLKVEWEKELSIPGHPDYGQDYLQLTSLLLSDAAQGMCSVSNMNGTTVFKFNNKIEAVQDFSLPVFTNWWQFSESNLYYKEGCSIVKTIWGSPVKQEERCYQVEANWPATSPMSLLYNGALYYATYGIICKFGAQQDPVFKHKIADLGDPKFIKQGGDKVFLYGAYDKLGSRLMQYDTLGNQKWSVPVGGVTNMFTDSAGNCYVITSSANQNSYLNKFNNDGSLAWSKETIGQWIVNGTVVDNKIYLAGQVTPGLTENPAGGAVTIMDLNTASILEQYHYDLYPDGTDDGWSEQFTHIAVDGETIYVGGYSGIYPKCYLIKLSREGSTTSLKEETNSKTSFSIFPNPGGSQFSISCEQSDVSTLNVTVRNISGQVVYKKQISCNDQKTFTLDLGKQATGNYSVEIVSGKDKTVKKIVVE